MPQTSIELTQNPGYPGTVAATSDGGIIRGALQSYRNDSSGVIRFGSPVVKINATQNTVQTPQDGTTPPLGIAVYNEYQSTSYSAFDTRLAGVPVGDIVSVYIGGFTDYWVRLDDSVVITDPLSDLVYFRFTANGTNEPGFFSNTAGAEVALWENVRFITPNYLRDGVNIAAINIPYA